MAVLRVECMPRCPARDRAWRGDEESSGNRERAVAHFRDARSQRHASHPECCNKLRSFTSPISAVSLRRTARRLQELSLRVFAMDNGQWRVAAFHNTMIRPFDAVQKQFLPETPWQLCRRCLPLAQPGQESGVHETQCNVSARPSPMAVGDPLRTPPARAMHRHSWP
jgi:hypothetical protein